MGSCTDFNTCAQSKFGVLVVLVSFSKHLNPSTTPKHRDRSVRDESRSERFFTDTDGFMH